MELRVLFLAVFAALTFSSRKREPFRYMIGDKRRYERYNYRSIEEKLNESYQSHCPNSSSEQIDSLSWELSPPDSTLVASWLRSPPSRTLIDKDLCLGNEKYFDFVGCSKGVQLHPDAPRCHREATQRACAALVSKDSPIVLEDAAIAHSRGLAGLNSTSPFLVSAKHGFIAACGGVALKCGVLQMQTGKFGQNIVENRLISSI
jgi:hypothetical protein